MSSSTSTSLSSNGAVAQELYRIAEKWDGVSYPWALNAVSISLRIPLVLVQLGASWAKKQGYIHTVLKPGDLELTLVANQKLNPNKG